MIESRKTVTNLVTFQVELAKQCLIKIATTVRHTALIVVLLMGPFIIGMMGFVVLGALMAPSRSAAQAVILILGQSALIALPVFMVRKSVLPDSLLLWRSGLPIRWQAQLAADVCTVAALLLPLFFACSLSALIWFWQWPKWLHPVWFKSLLCLLTSMIGGLIIGVLILQIRGRALHWNSFSIDLQNSRCNKNEQSSWELWRLLCDLILKPLWRTNSASWQLLHYLLILGGAGCVGIICFAQSIYAAWQGSLALLLATISIGVTLWRDSVVQTNHAVLMSEIAAWPVSASRLFLLAKLWAILPCFVFAVFFLVAFQWSPTGGMNAMIFFGLLIAGPYALLTFSEASTPGRAGFASCLWVLLIISGSSL